MLNICTLFDKNYLGKGLAMIESVIKIEGEQTCFHILAIDEECNDKLQVIFHNNNNVHIYSLPELESLPELQRAKAMPPTAYGSQRDNYMWVLCPWFVNYLLINRMVAEHECLMYADSDLFFYHSPGVILDKMRHTSFGIHTHRFTPSYEEYIKLPLEHTKPGFFNVGALVVRNNTIGRTITNQWKDWCLDATNEYYKEFGTCGDQKWLQLIYEKWKNDVCVFDLMGISHFAPWNADTISEFLPDDYVIYKGNKEPLVIGHFSHFVYQVRPQHEWRDSHANEWHPANIPGIREYYKRYFQSLIDVHTKYNF